MMILFGLMMELHNQTTEKTNWTAFGFGCIAGVRALGGDSPVLRQRRARLRRTPSRASSTVSCVSLFVFFNVFAINMVLQYKKVGPWKDYLFGEKVYILLSLLAKSVLAWQVFAGTLR